MIFIHPCVFQYAGCVLAPMEWTPLPTSTHSATVYRNRYTIIVYKILIHLCMQLVDNSVLVRFISERTHMEATYIDIVITGSEKLLADVSQFIVGVYMIVIIAYWHSLAVNSRK
jgi:hypothetical protein